MKKLLQIMAVTLAFSGFAFTATNNAHALITIDQTTDVFVSGDFTVAGNDVASGTGQNYEVLKFKPDNKGNSTSCDGCALDTAPHGDVSVGDLWSHLNDNGLSSANVLGFGFDVNENDVFMDVTTLTIKIGNVTYATGDVIRVYDGICNNGSSCAEAKFLLALDYDFMTTYNAGSTEEFTITANHANTNAGFEEYFLSSAFSTGNPPPPPPPGGGVPEPLSMMLMGSGLVGTVLLRKKK